MRVGEYVAAGTRMLSIVPINDLWVEANYRETQIGRMKVGDPVRIDVDTYSGRPICGYVEAILPAAVRVHPTTTQATSRRSYGVSPCASASAPATPTRLSPVPACRWKPPLRSPHPTTPLRPNGAIGSAALSTRQRIWSCGRSPSYRSIPGWAALALRVPPAHRFRYRRHV